MYLIVIKVFLCFLVARLGALIVILTCKLQSKSLEL